MRVHHHRRSAIALSQGIAAFLLFAPLGLQPAVAVSPSSFLAQNAPNNGEEEKRVLIAEVVVRGAEEEMADRVLEVIETKAGEVTTRSQLQADINAIYALGYFANVQAIPEDTEIGVRVTFAVELNPILRRVEVKLVPEGNSILPPEVLAAIFQPQYDRVLNYGELQQGIQELTQWYEEQGYVLAQVVGQPEVTEQGTVTLTLAEGRIEGIEVQFLNVEGEEIEESAIAPAEILEAMQLKVGSTFNRQIAQEDLQAIQILGGFEDVRLALDPGEDPSQVVVVIKIFGEAIAGEVEEIIEAAKELEEQKNSQQAIAKYEEAAAVYAAQGNREGQGNMLAKIGDVYAAKVKTDEESENTTSPVPSPAVAPPPESEDVLGLSQLLSQAGSAKQTSTQQQKAQESWNQAIAIFREIGSSVREAQELHDIGQFHRQWGNREKAEEYLSQALTLAQTLTEPEARWLEMSVWKELGVLARELGNEQQAVQHFQKMEAAIASLEPAALYHSQFLANISWKRQKKEETYRYVYEATLTFGEDTQNPKDNDNPFKALTPDIFKTVALFNLGQGYKSLEQESLQAEALREALAIVQTLQATANATDEKGSDYLHFLFAPLPIYLHDLLGERQQALTAIAKNTVAARETIATSSSDEAIFFGISWLWQAANLYILWEREEQGLAMLAETAGILRSGLYSFSEVGRPFLSAQMFALIAQTYQSSDKIPEAIASLDESVQWFQKSPEIAVIFLPILLPRYEELGEPERGLAKLKESLPLMRDRAEKPEDLATVLDLGASFNATFGDKKTALALFEEAIILYRDRLQQPLKAAAKTVAIAELYEGMGEFESAIAQYEAAATLYEKAGESRQEAILYHAIGKLYQETGEYQQAFNAFDRAAQRFRAGENPAEATVALSSIAALYHLLGDNAQALKTFEEALALVKELGDGSADLTVRAKEVGLLITMARFHYSLGENQLALQKFKQAQQRWQTAEGNILGSACTTLNEEEQKLCRYLDREVLLPFSQFAQPLTAEDVKASDFNWQKLWQIFGNEQSEAVILAQTSLVLLELGEKEQAIATFRQAVELAKSTVGADIRTKMFFHGAILYESLGDLAQASYYLQQGLQRMEEQGFQTRDRALEVNLHLALGRVSAQSGEDEKAREAFNAALEFTQESGQRSLEAEVLLALAQFERDRGNSTAALAQIESALDIIESLRASVASANLRTSFFAAKQGYYEFYIDLLMQLHQENPGQGYDAKALHASERAKARTLLELLAEAKADIRQGVDPALLERERNLQGQLDRLEKRRLQLYSSNASERQIENLEGERERAIAQYRAVRSQIRASSPKYAALTQPQPLTLAQIQQQILDEDTLLLQYSLGEERSYLWLVSQGEIKSYQLPPRKEIETAARQFYTLLNDPGFNLKNTRGLVRVVPLETPPEVPKLSQMLLGKVAAELGNKRLLVVGDGALQYIPFAALPTPDSEGTETPIPLVRDREIVNLPSASTLGVLRNELQGRLKAPKQLAILADPVFAAQDSRLSASSTRGTEENLNRLLLDRSARTADIGLKRLPGTRREAEAIAQLVPEAQRTQVFDFAANRTFATHPQLSQYQIVHFATHGILNSVNPELSGIVLSLVDRQGNPQNGFLRLHDVFNLNLPAELVVLSACQTGLGQEVKGEGLVGLTRGFMYAGTPRVLVSLWNVDDAATAEMMARFYRLLLQENLSATAALRQAQLEMQTETEWKNPYFWAAFTLQGEWQ